MKKSIYSLVVVVVVLLVKTTNLQAQSYDVGSNVINLGVGFLSSYGYYNGTGGSSTPVIAASFEHGIIKLGPGTVGIGAAIDYQGASYTYSYGLTTIKDKYTTTLFGVRGTYHPDFCNGDKYDVYGVLQLSFDHVGYSETVTGPYSLGYGSSGGAGGGFFYPYLLIGGRYYFTDNIGGFAELGYDLAFFKIGLSAKFGGGK